MRRNEPVPADRIGSRRPIIRPLERVAGQHAETVRKGRHIRGVGRVVARKVIDESAADEVDVGEGTVRPLKVAAERRRSEPTSELQGLERDAQMRRPVVTPASRARADEGKQAREGEESGISSHMSCWTWQLRGKWYFFSTRRSKTDGRTSATNLVHSLWRSESKVVSIPKFEPPRMLWT